MQAHLVEKGETAGSPGEELRTRETRPVSGSREECGAEEGEGGKTSREGQSIKGRVVRKCRTTLWVIRCRFGRDRLSTNVRFASIPTVNSGLWDLSRWCPLV